MMNIKLILLILSLFLFGFTLYFFRDPIRQLPVGITPNDIISPADGKVFIIDETTDDAFLKSRAKIVAIFLSPLDVHVNRIPISGKIDYYSYVKGGFKAAFRHSSENNEQTLIGITAGGHKVFMKQIAGFIARRIVCNLREGANVQIGEKFGMIRFGSRMDLIMPLGTDIKVKLNQKVTAGETIIAILPH